MAEALPPLIPTPALLPWRYGLFAAATVTTDEGRWRALGFSWDTDTCAEGGVWNAAMCAPEPVTDPATLTWTAPAPVNATLTAQPADATTTTNLLFTLSANAAGPQDIIITLVGTNPRRVVAHPGGKVFFETNTLPGEYTIGYPGTDCPDLTLTSPWTAGADPFGTCDVVPAAAYPVTLQLNAAATRKATVSIAGQSVELTGGAAATTVNLPSASVFPITATMADNGAVAVGSVDATKAGSGVLNFLIAVTKTVPEGIDYTESSEPFTVYAGVECQLLALGDADARARRRLAFTEPRLVEAEFFSRHLATAATVDLTPAAGPVNVKTGVGMLEEALAQNYGALGIIHAPRRFMPWAANKGLIKNGSPALLTPLDTGWAFGAGYALQGPDGTPAPDGETWLYATGFVQIMRGDIFVPAGVRDGAFDRTNNLARVIAERTYALAVDCNAAWAVRVQTPTTDPQP